MTPAEFRCLYEYLGVTRSWIANFLNVDVADVVRWEESVDPVPAPAASDLGGLARVTSELVHQLAADLQWGGTITTYRTDAQFRAADPFGLNYPASAPRRRGTSGRPNSRRDNRLRRLTKWREQTQKPLIWPQIRCFCVCSA
jgi:hypothetical protein